MAADWSFYTQQPTKNCSRNGGEYEGEIRQAWGGGGGGSTVLSFWGCYKLRGGKKINLIVELSNYSFSQLFSVIRLNPNTPPLINPFCRGSRNGASRNAIAMPLDWRPAPPWWCCLLVGKCIANHSPVLFLLCKSYGRVIVCNLYRFNKMKCYIYCKVDLTHDMGEEVWQKGAPRNIIHLHKPTGSKANRRT